MSTEEWSWYRKRGETPMRPYKPGEDLSGVSIPDGHKVSAGDWIARNPEDPSDQWLMSAAYHEANYLPVGNGLSAPAREQKADERGAPAWWKDGKPNPDQKAPR